MKTVQLYGLKNCSTCVKAMRWLEQQGVDFSFTDYRDNPVAPQALSAWAQELGGWEKLVNRASMTWRNLDRKSVVWGKSVSVRVDLGGPRIIKKTREKKKRK